MPPAAQRLHRERGSAMAGAGIDHPALAATSQTPQGIAWLK
jgi:hypothetical protein